MIRLGRRLEAAASLVRAGSVAADVGTDHGLLACFLVQSGRSSRVYATDINPLPLSKAGETIRANGLTHLVETVLTDGLTGLEGRGVTDIIIAGMGGEMIASILERAEWTREESLSFVLQPMTRPEALRTALAGMGFAIRREIPVVEGSRAYTVMLAVFTGKIRTPSLEEAWAGPYFTQRSPEGDAYLRKQQGRLKKILRGMKPGTTEYREYTELIKKMEG